MSASYGCMHWVGAPLLRWTQFLSLVSDKTSVRKIIPLLPKKCGKGYYQY